MSNRIDKTLDKWFLKFTPYIKYFILHIAIAQVKHMLLIWNRMIETKTQTLFMSHPLQQIYLRTIQFSRKETEYNKRKLGNSVLPKGWIKSLFRSFVLCIRPSICACNLHTGLRRNTCRIPLLHVQRIEQYVLLIRPKKKTNSAQTNIASKLRKLQSCGCACSKADEKDSIFLFSNLFFDHGKGFKINFKEFVFFFLPY